MKEAPVEDSGSGRRSAPGGSRSEYTLALPDHVDVRQLLLALGAAAATSAPTLREFGPRFIQQYARANRQKPRGVSSKESHLEHHLYPVMGDKRLDEIGPTEVQALKASMGGLAAKTVNNVLSTLNKLLAVAVEWRVIVVMPVRIEPLPTVAPAFAFYDREQYQELVIGAAGVGPHELAAVLLGGDCGLRMGEIIAVEWPDIDLARELLHVQRSESKGEITAPKGNKTRYVPLTPELTEALRRIPNGQTRRVFHNAEGAGLSEQNLRTWLSQAQRKAGLPSRGALHILRHTYCSHLAMAGVPLLSIKELAGHVSERTTLRYMHLAPGEKNRAIEALERWRQRPTCQPPDQSGR